VPKFESAILKLPLPCSEDICTSLMKIIGNNAVLILIKRRYDDTRIIDESKTEQFLAKLNQEKFDVLKR
jgi:hypothetical protein